MKDVSKWKCLLGTVMDFFTCGDPLGSPYLHHRTADQGPAEISEREKSQKKKKKTFNNILKQYDDKEVNIEQIALNLNGMRPEAAVNILLAMDDQNVIDVLRKVEEIAKRDGASSMGSYWLSLMPADRAAEIQRKMLSKPEKLNSL